ncbi:tRNA1(Val) (adenine(37)-N6)-methyltransferase [Actinobacillus porcinus]|uniref:tRNA1(Val) (adenine(37)-N6)-methyltransferase n=1 Tax=Actinobacillus porcinus TaxID=51048 RepID=UPI002355A078|nr:tRNA1(Val) (adenine(37)-N6)-methyltransferase [Actinobacillus porcinus]MCI5764250.1 tRNA1(Val) (adenine(37)-N6)-methyltransferase [Actinobacillus porcinus]MDY5421976.1 tRNA1(Val) (adenine(37)-N6)-methyltransferase [Actinobacillus porcinus]
MAKSQGFTFKQFHINHHRCAMKVGTDGILLGAWADIKQAQRILDLGTGTGLIALMLAQRSHHSTQIMGIEIDPEAAAQAQENAANSPWATRIQIVHQDIADFATKCGENSWRFDVIVANPPYFESGVNCRTEQRNTARYTTLQSHVDWLNLAEKCLAENGQIHFVLPTDEGETLIKSTALYCVKRCDVVTKTGKRPKRVLLTFQRNAQKCEHSELVIYDEQNQYTAEFKTLTKDFYLKF